MWVVLWCVPEGDASNLVCTSHTRLSAGQVCDCDVQGLSCCWSALLPPPGLFLGLVYTNFAAWRRPGQQRCSMRSSHRELHASHAPQCLMYESLSCALLEQPCVRRHTHFSAVAMLGRHAALGVNGLLTAAAVYCAYRWILCLQYSRFLSGCDSNKSMTSLTRPCGSCQSECVTVTLTLLC